MVKLCTVAILSLLVLPACVQNEATQVPEIDDNSASVRGEHFILYQCKDSPNGS
jgi:hypothetical protein